MDYLHYVLVVLAIGLICFGVVRLATRSKNPDLLIQYKAREKRSRVKAAEQAAIRSNRAGADPTESRQSASKAMQNRHPEQIHSRTPWGWPGAARQNNSQGFSETVRDFTDRLVSKKQVSLPGSPSHNSIRALLEDRYGPVNRGMTEIPYQKVKRPLLRDPSEQHDQLDNLGSAQSKVLRKKLQFLSAMNNDDLDKTTGEKKESKVEFRYVELKDLKQPWGW